MMEGELYTKADVLVTHIYITDYLADVLITDYM